MSDKPKKPLNAYFKFRAEKLADFGKDEENKMDKVKKAWESLDPKVKSEMEEEYHKQLEEYKIDIAAWGKENKGGKDDKANKSKPKESKAEKAKGAKPDKKGKNSDGEEKEKSDKKGKKEAEKRGQSKKEEKPAGRDKSKKK